MQAAKLRQEIKESNARIANINQDTLTKGTQSGKNVAETFLTDTKQQNEALRAAGIRHENELKRLDVYIKNLNMWGVENKAEFDSWLLTSGHNLLYQKLKHAAPIIRDYAQAVGTITGAFNLRNILGRKSGSSTTQTTKFNRDGTYQGGSVTTRIPNR